MNIIHSTLTHFSVREKFAATIKVLLMSGLLLSSALTR
jgi:hypothetical protein